MKIYGIKNCQSVKKSLNLLDEKKLDYEFIDYKKNPPSTEKVKQWIEKKGVDKVVNKRGMMWKKLSEEQRNNLTEESALTIVRETPTIVKRPVIESGDDLVIGFDEVQQKFA